MEPSLEQCNLFIEFFLFRHERAAPIVILRSLVVTSVLDAHQNPKVTQPGVHHDCDPVWKQSHQ